MSAEIPITVIAFLIFVHSLVGKQLEEWNITQSMSFLVAGIILGLILEAFSEDTVGRGSTADSTLVLLLAEITLVFILFHDASSVTIGDFSLTIPSRLLLIGLPLTMLALYFFTYLLFPDLGFYGTLLIAAALTPTDAGLGAPTVLNPKVPTVIRYSLNVESGVNDGMVTPVVLICIAGLFHFQNSNQSIAELVLVPIAIAVAISVVAAPLSSKLLDFSNTSQTSTELGREMALLTVPLFVYGAATLCGGNAFIAAYLTGFGVGFWCKELTIDHSLSHLLSGFIEICSDASWFFAGELIVYTFKQDFHWEWVVIAVLALTVLRIIPVCLCLLGTGLDFPTMGFIGWFGPRGLATVIFAFFVLEGFDEHASSHNLEGETTVEEKKTTIIIGALLMTVLISVFAHGISASPGCIMLAEWIQKHPLIEEHEVLSLRLEETMTPKRMRTRNTRHSRFPTSRTLPAITMYRAYTMKTPNGKKRLSGKGGGGLGEGGMTLIRPIREGELDGTGEGIGGEEGEGIEERKGEGEGKGEGDLEGEGLYSSPRSLSHRIIVDTTTGSGESFLDNFECLAKKRLSNGSIKIDIPYTKQNAIVAQKLKLIDDHMSDISDDEVFVSGDEEEGTSEGYGLGLGLGLGLGEEGENGKAGSRKSFSRRSSSAKADDTRQDENWLERLKARSKSFSASLTGGGLGV